MPRVGKALVIKNDSWVFVPESDNFYLANRRGLVFSVRSRKVLKTSKGKYPRVTIRQKGKLKNCYVHDLIALTFIGPKPKGFEVCHTNGNGRDCRSKNLRYGTRRENALDRRKHGTQCPKGIANKLCKLNKKELLWARREMKNGYSARALSVLLEVSHRTLSYQLGNL